MNCEHYRKQLSRQVDIDLDRALTEELEKHLAACPECRSFRDGVKALNREFHTVGRTQPPVGLAERVKERVDRQRRRDRVLLPAWTRVPLVAMITLAAVGLGNLAGRSISSMLIPDRSEDAVEYTLVTQAPSFADLLTDNGSEENGQ
ncbi:MAG: zf-HC2 domain-containing protein [Desulfomonile sp.]|nr:zf-HC2 domain-containing protein [Desulfomonile sp.]